MRRTSSSSPNATTSPPPPATAPSSRRRLVDSWRFPAPKTPPRSSSPSIHADRRPSAAQFHQHERFVHVRKEQFVEEPAIAQRHQRRSAGRDASMTRQTFDEFPIELVKSASCRTGNRWSAACRHVCDPGQLALERLAVGFLARESSLLNPSQLVDDRGGTVER